MWNSKQYKYSRQTPDSFFSFLLSYFLSQMADLTFKHDFYSGQLTQALKRQSEVQFIPNKTEDQREALKAIRLEMAHWTYLLERVVMRMAKNRIASKSML